MLIFSSLSRQQKEAVGLLQVGTFLEYFDLMLYVYMSVLLNELFFPKTDPHTASLLSSLAFCSTFVLRPVGALLFGWIGDNIGRKSAVIITTLMMAISCTIMANLPTYAQIGITSAWLITGCRIVQGLSSMGEVICAEIYISEITKPPVQYLAVSCIPIASQIGSSFALAIAALVTHFGFNWRIAFWMGAGIAVIGSVARFSLRETPEFIMKMQQIREKSRIKNQKAKGTIANMISIQKLIHEEKMDSKTYWAYLIAACGWPMSFYLVFMYFSNPLKFNYGYTAQDIIFHNFLLSLISLFSFIVLGVLSYKHSPVKIIKIKGLLSLAAVVMMPFAIINASSPVHLFLIQSLLVMGSLSLVPASAVFFKYIATLKRVTTASFVYALSRAVIYVITSFSLVYLTELFGYYGLWLVALPINLGFLWSVYHLEDLEKQQSMPMVDLRLGA